jgi:hypothetical protein
MPAGEYSESPLLCVLWRVICNNIRCNPEPERKLRFKEKIAAPIFAKECKSLGLRAKMAASFFGPIKAA